MIVIKYCDCDLADPKCDHVVKYDNGLSEIKIMDDAECAYLYAKYVIKGKWPEGEEIIKTDPEYAYWYAYNVIKSKWPKGEEIIKTSPKYAYLYAREVIKGRWREGEKIIKSDSTYTYLYICDVIKHRWLIGERITMGSPEYACVKNLYYIDGYIGGKAIEIDRYCEEYWEKCCKFKYLIAVSISILVGILSIWMAL